MISRRTCLALGATGAAGALVGCLDFVTGTGPLEFESSLAAPTDDALAEAGFEEVTIHEETVEEVVDVGVERELRATVWVASYAKTIDLGGAAVQGATFVAVSMPGMRVAGSARNPIADMDAKELLEEFGAELEGEFGGLGDFRYQESFPVEILGEERTVDVFHGTGDHEGEEIELRLEITHFAHEDDVLVLFGGYPTALPDSAIGLDALLASVDHPVDVD